ncbi:ABC transporter substrate-binding protein [Streptomyces sp. NPDC029044]|uniref:ABC transporter substrate-binding protein n=1 Tax=Streptomyces sp. NPDC029044 TaxID=3157198 RepID=UPI0033E942C9
MQRSMPTGLSELRPPGEPTRQLTVGVFPGAGGVPYYHALDSGYFQQAGLEVKYVQVVSSDQQMAGWNDGEFDLMHTSPDHLLRGILKRDPVVVRAEGMGELAVHRRPGAPLPTDRWAVDNAQSAFAFVLRAVLDDVAGLPVRDEQLVPVGGTLQRFQALPTEAVDGTTLHPPFDVLATEKGFPRVGGHLQVAPDLITNVLVTPRETATAWQTRAYVEVCRRSTEELLAAGAPGIEAALLRHGLPEAAARAAVPGLLGPAGLSTAPEVTLRGMEAVADLRRRYTPDWQPTCPLTSLIGPGREGAQQPTMKQD